MNKSRLATPLALFACIATTGLHSNLALAQDSFGNAPITQPPNPDARGQPQPYREPAPGQDGDGRDDSMISPDDSGAYGPGPAPRQQSQNEDQDFGIAPQSKLKPSNQLHGPTPTRIPGGLVVTTDALAELLKNPQSGAVVLDVYGTPTTLPNAIRATPAAQGGSFDDATQREFGQFLQQITNGDKNRPMVLYCAGVQCWMSYNASLRAIKLGYSKVLWYRGGLEAWTQAGLPTRSEAGQGPQPRTEQDRSGEKQQR